MNYILSNKFDHYIQNVTKYNLHKKKESVYKLLPKKINDLYNIIIYGKDNIGKYTQALYIINKYSPSSLKYERKITMNISNSKNYSIKISDIHYEIDFDLLGCSSKNTWNIIYKHIIDIINTKNSKYGIILCKNFQCIDHELLDVFYSYIQHNPFMKIKINFIFITNSITFIPNNIVNSSYIINYSVPATYKLNKLNKIFTNNNNIITKICNNNNYQKPMHIICNTIIDYIIKKDIDIFFLRETIYKLFIYQCNINSAVWYIYSNLINEGYIKNEMKFLVYIYKFHNYYNNNYRPIYHLESLIINFIIEIHEY